MNVARSGRVRFLAQAYPGRRSIKHTGEITEFRDFGSAFSRSEGVSFLVRIFFCVPAPTFQSVAVSHQENGARYCIVALDNSSLHLMTVGSEANFDEQRH
jgi:hypothetical protein